MDEVEQVCIVDGGEFVVDVSEASVERTDDSLECDAGHGRC